MAENTDSHWLRNKQGVWRRPPCRPSSVSAQAFCGCKMSRGRHHMQTKQLPIGKTPGCPSEENLSHKSLTHLPPGGPFPDEPEWCPMLTGSLNTVKIRSNMIGKQSCVTSWNSDWSFCLLLSTWLYGKQKIPKQIKTRHRTGVLIGRRKGRWLLPGHPQDS